MRIGVTGSIGLVGSALLELLTANGHEVHPIVRGMPADNQIGWNPAAASWVASTRPASVDTTVVVISS